jgi:hypothetical protein
MNSVKPSEPLIHHVQVTDEEIIARLADGLTITVPLAWFGDRRRLRQKKARTLSHYWRWPGGVLA